MSENSEQVTAAVAPAPEQEPDFAQPISHKRILLVMAAVVAIGALLGLVFISVRFGLGVFIGGSLSLVNYYWLKKSLKGVFEQTASDAPPRFLATRYFLRYLVFGAILAIVYLTKAVPVVAVILGLASFALAIIVEAFIRITFKKREI